MLLQAKCCVEFLCTLIMLFVNGIVITAGRDHLSLNATKRPFGHMDIGVGNSKKEGKSRFIHFGINTAFVCFEHWITKLTN